jgi:hypothetical protein
MINRMLSAAALVAICLGLIEVERLRGANDQNQALIELEHRWLHAEDDPWALEPILADDLSMCCHSAL